MKEENTRLGIALMTGASFVFAVQDGISRHLAAEYNTYMIVMIRYWFFAVFVMALAARKSGGLRRAVATRHPLMQPFRGLLLAAEVCLMVAAYVKLGLIETHVVFACYPLIVAALSGPVLGEHVGWRRWSAIAIGFVGILIILQPGLRVFSPFAFVPLLSAAMFALYGLLTRYVSRQDPSAVSFFWTGVTGAVAMTIVGLPHWQPLHGTDQLWMAALCCTAALGHWLLIRAFEAAEASAIQPFAYLQLVFIAAIGLTVFGEVLRLNVVIGAIVVVSAGLFTLWRARKVQAPAAAEPMPPA